MFIDPQVLIPRSHVYNPKYIIDGIRYEFKSQFHFKTTVRNEFKIQFSYLKPKCEMI